MARIFGYEITDTDKAYLLILVYFVGVILIWRGIWEINDRIPILKSPYVSLFLGLLILTLTGYIFREFDPLAQRLNRLTRIVHTVVSDIKRGALATIHYYDEVHKKHKKIDPKSIMRVEHGYIVTKDKCGEHFVPMHRVTRIHHKGKIIWRK
ncbi:MAG: RNA repair domain-containing protein [Candidatus Woesearchaeota archaeon]